MNKGVSDRRKLTHVGQTFFIEPETQLALIRKQNAARNWGLTNSDFDSLGESPQWPESKLAAVVLDVSLDTVQSTFEEAWSFAASRQPHFSRQEEIKSDPDHLALFPGTPHKPGIRWRVIDLAANWPWDERVGIWGLCPTDVRNPKVSPHSAMLWAAGYFPKWIRAMDGVYVPFVRIPGYILRIPPDTCWWYLPYFYWSYTERELELRACKAQVGFSNWAVPAYLS